jgi:mono/diheme cytochrome c family protein
LKQPIRSPFVPAALAAVALAGCHSASRATGPHVLTSAELQGQQIVQTHCLGCHYIHSKKTLVGPGLQGLFKEPYLPDGAPATDGYVRSKVIRGGNVMPAFGNSLDAEQMHDLLAYLHTL